MTTADEPTDAKGWVSKGAAHAKTSDREAALSCFEKALKLDPKNGPAWAAKAAVLSQLGRHQDALKSFEQVKTFAPPAMQVATRRYQATSLHAVGRSDDALKVASEAVAADPNDAQSWLAKADAEYKLGKRADAVRSLRKLMLLIDQSSSLYKRGRELQDVLELGESD